MSSFQHGIQEHPILIQRPRGDRPHLLHFNRRLRHLQGISFRNLAFPVPGTRPRGQTSDDDAVPYTLSSPAKLLALNENHELAHSQSSDNLRSEGKTRAGGGQAANGHARPPFRKPQRRNTAEWLSASPKQRRQKVHDAVSRHTGDVFFSVHVQDDAGAAPLYISEVAQGVMNHDYRSFDFDAYGIEISSQDACQVNFWSRRNKHSPWVQPRELKIDLPSLTYVGRSLDEFHHHLPENFAFIHLSDGIYAQSTDIVSSDDLETGPVSFEAAHQSSNDARPTSSYDALMRLSTLDACIQDALVTQARLTSEISDLLAQNNRRFEQSTHLTVARDQQDSVRRAITTTCKQITSLRTSVEQSRQSLDHRRKRVATGREAHAESSADTSMSSTLTQRKTDHSQLTYETQGQRRRLCGDLSNIYPIEPSQNSDSPLAFTIRSLYLPNSNFSTPNLSATTISAALGHTAHCIHHLSLYLSVLLPYPITPRASTSTITDPISLLPPSQSLTFPLSITARSDNLAAASGSSAFGRFEYAVFLLNKDVEALASKLGVRVLDIRQTLPNLKYVFLVATAGKGEVPKRLVGGVRGLLGKNLGGDGASAESSRRGSEDSGGGEAGRAAEELRKRLARGAEVGGTGTGKGKGKGRAE